MKLPFSTPWLPLVGVALAVAGGCGEVPEAEEEGAHAPSADPAELMESARSAFGTVEPVPEERLEDPEVVLGRELFWDERLSADGRTACASCHTREAWGADDRRLSPDARGELTSRQSHTVLNSTLQPTIRWRGDREDAAHQRVMARAQLGRTLFDSEMDRFVAFLESLTGDLPEHFAPPDG